MYHGEHQSGFGMPCCRPGMMHAPRRCGIGFGIVLILIGVFWLGSSMGWFDPELFWPVVFLAIGTSVLVLALTRGTRLEQEDRDKGGAR